MIHSVQHRLVGDNDKKVEQPQLSEDLQHDALSWWLKSVGYLLARVLQCLAAAGQSHLRPNLSLGRPSFSRLSPDLPLVLDQSAFLNGMQPWIPQVLLERYPLPVNIHEALWSRNFCSPHPREQLLWLRPNLLARPSTP